MENVRIMVMDANGKMCAFLDNSAPGAMHYWNDRLHTYLRGSAYTFEFRTFTSHEDSAFLAVGNSLSFMYRGRGYYLSIMTSERSEDYTDVTAYGLSLELTNEETGSYKAASAMSFEQYIDAFNFEKPFKIGINEVSDKRITHEWEGSDTILSRLFSLADVFGAEIEFTTELNDDYSLKQMTMNVYREHGDDCQGIGSDMRKGTPLRYGSQVSGITKKSDITELYTAIRPTGTDGLTLAGIDRKEYDSSGSLEYTSPSGTIEILAPQARDRFPSTLMADVNGRYICKVWSYDTPNVNVLYGQALAQLKKLSVPEVSYTVEGFTDGDIGDTYTIEDDEYRPALYLEARITEQEISFTDESQSRTTFDNFREVQSEISSELVDEMKKLISDKRMYDTSISTDNGILFKDRSGKSVLTAVIKDGGADVTSRLSITWYRDGTKIGEGQSITVSASDFDDKAVYGYEARTSGGLLKGTCEVTCMFLENGAAGDSAYLHIMYADDEKGTGMTSIPSGKKYMGQYSDSSMYNSQDASKYRWSLIQGPKGDTGLRGATGATGATGPQGPQGPKGEKGDTGARGLQGLQGEKGEQGIAGPKGDPGSDGRTSYFHIKYSIVANPSTASDMSETPEAYIGTYVDFTEADSSDPKKYTWTQFRGSQGPKGDKGIAGTNGTNGKTSYLHIAYATSAGGKTGFSVSDSAGKTYIGQYTDFTEADSTDPSKYSWTLIKGDKGDKGDTGPQGLRGLQGPKGDQGIQGPKGDNGSSSYTHIAYATSSDGSTGFSTSDSAGKTYIGMYVDHTSTDSTSPSSYRWTLIKGPQGARGEAGATGAKGEKGDTGPQGPQGLKGDQGIPGKAGADGRTPYLHMAYANSSDGATSFNVNYFSGALYVGTYTDYTQADSTNYKSYTWARLKGDKGDKGADGKGIKSTAVTYQAGSSQTSAPAGSWLTSVPKLSPAAPYLWTKTVITYTDGNTSTSFSVSSTLDGIEIGGRNLWINSSRYRESTPYSKTDSGTDNYTAYFDGKCIYSIEPFKAGDIITIQGKSNLPWAKKHGGDSTNNGTVGYWLYYGTLEQVKTGNYTLPVFVSLDGVSTVFKKTLTIPSISGLDTIYIAFRFNSYSYNSVSITAKFWDIKLEKGNKATDWTPAPEDVHDIEIEPSAPSDKTRLWYDTNSSLLKKYDESSGDWMVVNDASDDINSSAQAITAAYTSSIEKVKNSITSTVDVAVSKIDSNEKTIETLSTQIQQNASAITATTNTVKSVTDSLSGYTTKVEIREWARFSNGVLELGKSSSNFNTKLSNTELGFYEIGKRIAFISNQELNITKARILDKMYIGDYLVDDDDDYGFIIM